MTDMSTIAAPAQPAPASVSVVTPIEHTVAIVGAAVTAGVHAAAGDARIGIRAEISGHPVTSVFYGLAVGLLLGVVAGVAIGMHFPH